MKAPVSFLIVLFFTLTLLILPGHTVFAQDSNGQEKAFVDLDGDGFDDNIADDDGDGIPNTAESSGAEEANDKAGKSDDTFMITPIEITSDFDFDQLLPNSERFGKLKFSLRAQCCFRGGFDADNNFGPGNGIGAGAISGCAGGVCH